jgi:hypothetical protein
MRPQCKKEIPQKWTVQLEANLQQYHNIIEACNTSVVNGSSALINAENFDNSMT